MSGYRLDSFPSSSSFHGGGVPFHRSHQMLTLVAPLQRTQHNSIALLDSISASTNIQSISPHHIAEQGISNRWATIRTPPHSSKLKAFPFPAVLLHALSLSGPESKFCEFCGVQDLATMVLGVF
jgi:hypothetical protein